MKLSLRSDPTMWGSTGFVVVEAFVQNGENIDTNYEGFIVHIADIKKLMFLSFMHHDAFIFVLIDATWALVVNR